MAAIVTLGTKEGVVVSEQVDKPTQSLSLWPLVTIVAIGLNAYLKNWAVVVVLCCVLFCTVADQVIRKAGK